MTTSPLQRAVDAFASELARWRSERGMSKKQLAAEMGFDPSYISHIERRRHRPTEDFARRAEAVLRSGGAIWRRYTAYDELRQGPARAPAPVPHQWLPPGTGLVVEQEVAELSLRDRFYHCLVRRELYNAATEPVTRYPVKIAIDRFPGDPRRSNRYHRHHPLTWAELDLTARCGQEPMLWRPVHDRDAYKEAWLLFENDATRFPLYPGERATIEIRYKVGADKAGQWFERSMRLPTRHLEVRLDLPSGPDPVVWGTESSLSAEAAPLRTPVTSYVDGDRTIFTWSTMSPALHAQYRVEWRFRGPGAPAAAVLPDESEPLSERLREFGVAQRGDEVLTRSAQPFTLPADEARARDVASRLLEVLDRVRELLPFGEAVSLAAPQIGLPCAAVAVRPANPEAAPVVLLNPRVVSAAVELDEGYEACLSFADVRGLVARPTWIEVEHLTWSGEPMITRFDQGLARLVDHGIDHLSGTLYPDKMAPGAPLVPVERYPAGARTWR
ncbi:MAG TPA: peptide deformylase [Micromonosporaceae bacterium]